MTDSRRYQAEIDSELQEIIPAFFDNTRQEIEELAQATAQGDYETIQRLGHGLKGSSLGYGFEELADIGRKIEDAAQQGLSITTIQEFIKKAAGYIDTVVVTYR